MGCWIAFESVVENSFGASAEMGFNIALKAVIAAGFKGALTKL